MIKLGAGAAPVALTLASRPVFAAGQCNSTSAWGSAILRNGVASVQARATAARLDNPVWSLSQLSNDTAGMGVGGGAKPWAYIFGKRYTGANTGGQTVNAYAQTTLKVSDLFPSGISGYSGAPATVHAWLQANQSTSNFVTCLLVARINALYAGNAAAQCLGNQQTGDILGAMATGSFRPTNGSGNLWSASDILQYLRDNNYVVA